ncbi:GerAB/ArcD/ProY family transporter [Gottfriedia solisilvae]|uniref:Spore germination protein KB n=1 Tax=Gottfriedia solisilvae TaxID=1516104 RepID=A0A8J3F2Z7_9BACI|nr:GerAB/ArcD/ProY family transporter [Gottfriedia solisilvae]GGI18256.1 spore germination protein KB [Gottfriedia solisilvae]
MNRKIVISGYQFFCTMFLFEVGTASLVSLAPRAKQDAWIGLLLSLILGCLLYYVYTKIFETYPDIPFTQYVQIILGEYAGKIVVLTYIIYFIYMASLILRKFEELLVMTLFNSSSLILIGILMLFLIMYGLFKGIETIVRTNEVIFVLIILIFVLIITLEFISKVYHLDNLRPVLENGWTPIIKAAIPQGLTLPFGEVITFIMLMPLLNKKEKALKVGLPALIFSGLILLIFTIKNIAILGVPVLERTLFPLLTSISYINIVNFVQRLDSFIVIFMVCGGFAKITVFFYCAVSGSADIFNIKKSEQLIYPIGVIILLSSLWLSPNIVENDIERFEILPYYLHIPLQIIIPICLLVISLIQRRLNEDQIQAKK